MIFIFEKDMKFPLLLDAYGVLLSDRKREILDFYYNEDYSLSEISELTGISRQGVRDSIKKSEEEIYQLEARLKLAEKTETLTRLIRSVITDLDDLALTVDENNRNRFNSITDRLTQVSSLLETARTGEPQE